jgi:hypothetical protein
MKVLINTPPGCDLDEIPGLAAHSGFDGIQLYLNSEIAADIGQMDRWRGRVDELGLDLAVHLPPEPDSAVIEALEQIVRPDVPVISHYPDSLFSSAGGITAWEFSPFGILPAEYQSWLDRCRAEGAVPVFDPPRIWKETDEREARRFADRVFTRLSGVRYILHLIDCPTADQTRDSWCRMGQGQVGRYLEQAAIPLPEVTVLEFESLILSIDSLAWVRRLAGDVGV